MSRVLIAGCGQLGSRHLQAVATLTGVDSIDVFDPRPEALCVVATLALGRTALVREIADRLGYRAFLLLRPHFNALLGRESDSCPVT